MVLWLGGAFGFLGSLASGLLASSASKRQARASRRNVDQTNKANLELAKYQFQKNREMWYEMQDYNAPAMQMKRFKEAGLNPNLIYGQGSPGNVQSHPQFEAPQLDYTGRPSVSGAELGAYAGVPNAALQLGQAIESLRIRGVDAWLAEYTKWYKSAKSSSEMHEKTMNAKRAEVEVTISKIRKRIEQVKANYWEKGMNPNDKIWLRLGIKALEFMGVNVESVLEGIPDKMKNEIME